MPLVGNENKRVVTFGKRHRVSVTFTRKGRLWHAHASLLPYPQSRLRVAAEIVRARLRWIKALDDAEL